MGVGTLLYFPIEDGLRSLGITWSNEKVRHLLCSISGDEGVGTIFTNGGLQQFSGSAIPPTRRCRNAVILTVF